jgi:PTS system mannose-specific IIB component
MSKPTAPLLVRIDNRLVHGQVIEAWMPALQARSLFVVDDEAATDPLARTCMCLALCESQALEVLQTEEAAKRLSPGGAGLRPSTIVLLREVATATALARAGVRFPQLNLGNVHFRAGRRQVAPSIYLDAAELSALEELQQGGTDVSARAVPSDGATPLAALRARFEQASRVA